MTDYNEILDTQIDQDSAVTEDLMTQMRDNPIAIAEGATGAPRVQGLALGGVYAGSYSVTDTDWATFTDLDNIKAFTAVLSCSNGAGTAGELYAQTSSDGGSTWSGNKTIITVGGSTSVSDRIFVDLDSGDQFSMDEGMSLSKNSYASGVDALRFRMQYSGSSLIIGLIINEAFDLA